jgi:hypothetical protein
MTNVAQDWQQMLADDPNYDTWTTELDSENKELNDELLD